MIPFTLDRASELLTQAARQENGLARSIAETFRSNFWIAISAIIVFRLGQAIAKVPPLTSLGQ